jgi:hypothetical protein
MKTQSTVAVIIGAVGLILFTSLLFSKYVNQVSYVVLLCATGLVCLVLHGFSRLRELDLKNLKMTLDRMEQVKTDVYAKTEDLKHTSLMLSKLIAVNSALQGIISDDDTHTYSRVLVRKKTEELLKSLGVPEDEMKEVFKYQDALDEMKKHKGDPEEKRKQKWKEFTTLLKRDCGIDEKPEADQP